MTIDRRVVELPQTFMHTHIKREGSSLILENSEGLRVVCNSAFDVCSVTVSGWYFGKTGGLVSQAYRWSVCFWRQHWFRKETFVILSERPDLTKPNQLF